MANPLQRPTHVSLGAELESTADARSPGVQRHISGIHLRMLMRRHGWTIKALAAAYALTQARVREVRARGAQGFNAEEWHKMLTGEWPAPAPQHPPPGQPPQSLAARTCMAPGCRDNAHAGRALQPGQQVAAAKTATTATTTPTTTTAARPRPR